MSDERVYEMEHAELRGLWQETRIPLRYRKRVLAALCRAFDLPRIRVRSCKVPGAHGCYYVRDDGEPRIDLCPRSGSDMLTLAHEFAHYVTHMRCPRARDHGPTFLFHYMQVCDALRLVPAAGFRAACRKHGLRIARKKRVH